MKFLVTFSILFMLSFVGFSQTNVQVTPMSINFKSGINEAVFDSALNIDCNFFVDSLVKITFQNPEQLQKVQMVYMAEGKEPVTVWLSIEGTEGIVVFNPRNYVGNSFCGPSRIILNYYRNNMNIYPYYININL